MKFGAQVTFLQRTTCRRPKISAKVFLAIPHPSVQSTFPSRNGRRRKGDRGSLPCVENHRRGTSRGRELDARGRETPPGNWTHSTTCRRIASRMRRDAYLAPSARAKPSGNAPPVLFSVRKPKSDTFLRPPRPQRRLLCHALLSTRAAKALSAALLGCSAWSRRRGGRVHRRLRHLRESGKLSGPRR